MDAFSSSDFKIYYPTVVMVPIHTYVLICRKAPNQITLEYAFDEIPTYDTIVFLLECRCRCIMVSVTSSAQYATVPVFHERNYIVTRTGTIPYSVHCTLP